MRTDFTNEELAALSRLLADNLPKAQQSARETMAGIRAISTSESARMAEDREIRHLIERRVEPPADESAAELKRWGREMFELARFETLEQGVRLDTKSREKAEAAVAAQLKPSRRP